jgi:hypothetical protein
MGLARMERQNVNMSFDGRVLAHLAGAPIVPMCRSAVFEAR